MTIVRMRPNIFKISGIAPPVAAWPNGDAVQIAAIEATHRLMAGYINRESDCEVLTSWTWPSCAAAWLFSSADAPLL